MEEQATPVVVEQLRFGAFLKMRRDQWSVKQREVLLYLSGWTQSN